MNIMTPESDRWDEFFERLEGPEGCDFNDRTGKITWTCGGGVDQTLAKKVLAAMGFTAEEIEHSCLYFSSAGGHCDCEIIFNLKDAKVAR